MFIETGYFKHYSISNLIVLAILHFISQVPNSFD